MISLHEIRKAQRAEGPATILTIETANPPNAIEQNDYPDYYFRITNSEHKIELKEKFKRMCKIFHPIILCVCIFFQSYFDPILFILIYMV